MSSEYRQWSPTATVHRIKPFIVKSALSETRSQLLWMVFVWEIRLYRLSESFLHSRVLPLSKVSTIISTQESQFGSPNQTPQTDKAYQFIKIHSTAHSRTRCGRFLSIWYGALVCGEPSQLHFD